MWNRQAHLMKICQPRFLPSSVTFTLIIKLFTALQAKDGLIAVHTLQQLLLTKQRKLITNWKTTKQSTQLHVCNIILTYSLVLVELHLSTLGVISKKKEKKNSTSSTFV